VANSFYCDGLCHGGYIDGYGVDVADFGVFACFF
jgi:hypothetical protein